MENTNELSSSSLSFDSPSYLSNVSNSDTVMSSTGSEPVPNLDLLSLSKLSGSLEKLLIDTKYNYSDVEIVVEDTTVGLHRGILAARSPFFEELFKKGVESNGKPKYLMSELVPYGVVGLDAFMVFFNYVYTGKLKPSPPEVSTCVDGGCAHDACLPAINYAVELMYASATFQMKELVLLVQRRLLDFVDKAFVEDVIPILLAAFHCQLNQLLSKCVHKVARSDLDTISIEKKLPQELVSKIKALPRKPTTVELDLMNENGIKRIQKALDLDDVELVNLLLGESNITLDSAYALHYAAAYCNPKVVRQLLSLGTADLNRRNSRGYTVLHVAARRKDPSIIVALLNNGACVSDTTLDGQTAVTICRRLTRPKDNEATPQGQECSADWLCIDVLEREMRRQPLPGNMSISSTVVANDLHMSLLFFENRVAFARLLFPREARLAMEIAHANSTSEFPGFLSSVGSSGNLQEADLKEVMKEVTPEQTKSLLSRLQALEKTVEAGRRFFPNCSEVLDKFWKDMKDDDFLLEEEEEECSSEEQMRKKTRLMELKEDVMNAFHKDKAETSSNWDVAPLSSSSKSSSPRVVLNHKIRSK